jgi:hypothetical protein
MSAASVASLTVAAAPASADEIVGPVVASFGLNETSGASTFSDSVGGLVGRVGADVTTKNGTHTFATHLPRDGAFPGHTNVVPASWKLHQLTNPGSGKFSFTIRYNTSYSFGNILQKGQSTASGGYWKFENPNRSPNCLFRGGNGQTRTAYVKKKAVLSKGWHTITCVRTPTYVQMWVDGVAQAKVYGSTGTISNTAPLAIGGKTKCDGTKVTCDYFIGQIDFIEFRKG